MRAMILAAGLGTRLRPLTELRPKPALPVRGVPVLATNLALLAKHGFHEVIINTHHLPEAIHEVVEAFGPEGLDVQYSHEETLLNTGGGIRRAADFLRGSETSLVLAGDMLLDFDLTAFLETHQREDAAVTFLLSDDPRMDRFGSIGTDAEGRVRRIGKRLDLGGEARCGLYLSVTALSARALDTLPDQQVFGHLDDWIFPRLRSGAQDIRAQFTDPEQCTWEPVGTLSEYLSVNLSPPALSYCDMDALARKIGTRLGDDFVIGPTAVTGSATDLKNVVVWDGERVPDGLQLENGIFAGGAFHACTPLGETSK